MRTPRPAPSRASDSPVLTVVVDTEEEFDWGASFDRSATSVAAMDEIHRFQGICDAFHVRPAYVVDYPVATQERGYGPLREFRNTGRAEIGAHLHPWVSPPFDEEVTPRSSYPGNLPRDLEKAKLEHLVGAIESSFGFRPTVYKAGRYGFGTNTAEILEGLSFEIDTSFCPAFDLGADGGPDYSAVAPVPFWFGEEGRSLLEIPNTGAFVGFLGSLSRSVHRAATGSLLAAARLPGILSRLRAVDRLMLTPEGFTLDELRRLTRSLLDRGVRTFTFSLHSPSMKPGCTPYVASEAERAEFLDRCRAYFEFFLGEIGGTSMTPTELRAHLQRRGASLAA